MDSKEQNPVELVKEEENKKEFYLVVDKLRLHGKLDLPTAHPEKLPLVILIHGFTGHMEERHITAVAEAILKAGCACLRFEMYGHGQSDGRFEDHTILKWLSQALAIVDYARSLDFTTDLYLCGHSQGGLTVMLTAGLKHDLIKGLIPLSPATSILDGARKGEVLGFCFDPDHIPDEVCHPEWYDGRSLTGNYLRAAQFLHVEEAIHRFDGPVLLIHGDQDESVPLSCSTEAAAMYKNARLVVIPGDDHCYDLHLDMVTEAVTSFLKSFR